MTSLLFVCHWNSTESISKPVCYLYVTGIPTNQSQNQSVICTSLEFHQLNLKTSLLFVRYWNSTESISKPVCYLYITGIPPTQSQNQLYIFVVNYCQ